MTIAQGNHPFPSRTRKLSPAAPMVLPLDGGRVGRCQAFLFAPGPLPSQLESETDYTEALNSGHPQKPVGSCRESKSDSICEGQIPGFGNAGQSPLTMAAARCRLESVMSFFGSSSRSTWVRLVLSSTAILFLEIFFFFMASESCHATTSLTA